MESKKGQSLVSVIVPCYNGQEFIGEAIESVINQTYQNWELIIIDDGSTDESKKVMDRYLHDKRIQYIRHDKNKGISATRNTGIITSRGEYIAFLDQDDIWLPEKLERQLELFKKSNSKIGLVYTDVYFIDSNGKIFGQRNPRNVVWGKTKEVILKELFLQSPITMCSTMFRKKCFDQLGLLDEDLFGCDDYDIYLRVASKFGIRYIPLPLAKRRYHENSAAKSDKYRNDQIQAVIKACKMHAFLEKYRTKKLGSIFVSIGLFYMENNNFSTARIMLLKSIQYSPLNWKPYMLFLLSFFGKSGGRLLFTIRMAKAKFELCRLSKFKPEVSINS